MNTQIDEPLTCNFSEICFGLDRETDEKSMAAFLVRFTNKALLATLISRMTDEDITATVDFITGIMHKHLRENEYHDLFLDDN